MQSFENGLAKASSAGDGAEMRVIFSGDYSPARPLLKVMDENAFIVSNLECAFAACEVSTLKAYASVLPKSQMNNLQHGGFSALSLANNHVNDAGNFRETYVELTRRFPGIQFFGTTDKPFAIFEHSNTRTLIIACLEPCRSRRDIIFKQEDVTALIRKLRSSQPQSQGPTSIFIYPHWGKEGEYTRYPAPWQRRLAREWIDAGADGVFGSHSHVPQGRECYKGKPIYYSLGNFDFDHPESRLYEGTSDQLVVEFDTESGKVTERFNSDAARAAVERASAELANWNLWRWARKVGPFNLKKNTASWKLRLKKNFIKTLPKFLVWQVLPKTLLFRIASLCR